MQSNRTQKTLDDSPHQPVAISGTDQPVKSAKPRRINTRKLKDHQKRVSKLEARAQQAERAYTAAIVENEALTRKLAVQRQLIEHLRTRLETVTGLDIEQAVEAPAVDAGVATAVSVHHTLPPIDPSEFLPINEAPGRLQVLESMLRRANQSARNGLATVEQQGYCLLNRARASRLFADWKRVRA